MNKAFVKEDTDEDDDDLDPSAGSEPSGPAPPNYITPEGHARMRAELLQLLDTDRPEVVRIVSWAASNGDRSENGDYLYGKKRLREIDRRSLHALIDDLVDAPVRAVLWVLLMARPRVVPVAVEE